MAHTTFTFANVNFFFQIDVCRKKISSLRKNAITEVLNPGPLAHQGGHGTLTRGLQVQHLFTAVNHLRTIIAFKV